MSIFKCPGSELIRHPIAEDIKCPACWTLVEIWSDEAEARCPACGSMASRELAASCLNWCACARDCVGPEKYDRMQAPRNPKREKE